MNLIEAAEQALEALQIWQDSLTDPSAIPGWRFSVVGEKAVAALRAALAKDAMQRLTDTQQEMEATSRESRQVEPVAWLIEAYDIYEKCTLQRFVFDKPKNMQGVKITAYYAAPPKRKPLTDEAIHDCFQQKNKNKVIERRMIARAIERAHGIGDEE